MTWVWRFVGAVVGLYYRYRLGKNAASVVIPITATCYKMPQPPANKVESRDLSDSHAEIQRAFPLLCSEFRATTGNTLKITCTWRSVARQYELYQIGRRGIPGEPTVTKLDGYGKRSRHNVYPSQAIDVCVVDPAGQIRWTRKCYAPLSSLVGKYGLIWGGDWAMDDFPHLELLSTKA